MLLTSIPPLTEAVGPTDSIESCITQYATFSIPHDGKRVFDVTKSYASKYCTKMRLQTLFFPNLSLPFISQKRFSVNFYNLKVAKKISIFFK
jgi:hypothetical protein